MEFLKYKVSDGVTDLVPWTELPLESEGVIEVPGLINRIANKRQTKRYLTLFAVHDGGKHLPEEIVYTIKGVIGITPETGPKT